MGRQLLSAEAYRVYQRASDLQRRLFLQANGEPGPEHVLLALLQQGGTVVEPLQRVLADARYAFERQLFEETLRAAPEPLAKSRGLFLHALERQIANRLAKFAHEGDLLVAVFRAGSPAIRSALEQCKLSERRVLQALELDGASVIRLRTSAPPAAGNLESGAGPALAVLDQFGEAIVPDSHEPAVRFRDEIVSEVLATLCRRDQNNVLLVGEPGGGKSAVVREVARLTGLDAARLLSCRVEDLRQVEAFLKERIIGQDEAIRQVLDTIQVARSGLGLRSHRPDAVFLLAGPTGVGKTELAKCLSEALQGSPNKLVRFDMSEFMEEHSVAKLIGAPPGYVGFDRDARLCRAVQARAVVLFDEIEKAHPNLQHLFLQIFDDGRLTDAQGQAADFSQTIILMTTNLGTGSLAPGTNAVQLRESCVAAVHEFFTPEFLNRLDGVICMNFLDPAAVTRIAELQLRRAFGHLAQQGTAVTVNESAFDLVVREGYEPRYGARHLGRTVEQRILQPMAKFLLDHPAAANLRVSAQDDEIIIEGQP